MAIDPKRPAVPKLPPPPSSRRSFPPPPPSAREPSTERGPGFVWLLAPHPGRIRCVPLANGGVLGRGEDASLRIDGPGVAPSHANVELVPKAGGGVEIYVTDNGTSSGTYVSGMRASRTVLADGDLLRCGGAIALLVERDVGSYEGSVLEEGGLVRGPRSRRGWFAALEKAASEPREGRRAAVIAGPPGSGRRSAARRLGEAWGLALFKDPADGAADPHEVDVELGDDVDAAIAAAAAKGAVVLRGLDRATDAQRAAVARALEKRRPHTPGGAGLPVIAIVDDPSWSAPRELEPALSAHRIEIPSLEQRREEIPSLVRQRFEKRGVAGNRLSIELYEAMTRAAWPGEVRELVECVDRIAVSHPEVPRLGPEHLVRPLARRGGRVQTKTSQQDTQSEAERIRAALNDAKGSVAAAARALHLSRQALYREAARLGIDIRKARDSQA